MSPIKFVRVQNPKLYLPGDPHWVDLEVGDRKFTVRFYPSTGELKVPIDLFVSTELAEAIVATIEAHLKAAA